MNFEHMGKPGEILGAKMLESKFISCQSS